MVAEVRSEKVKIGYWKRRCIGAAHSDEREANPAKVIPSIARWGRIRNRLPAGRRINISCIVYHLAVGIIGNGGDGYDVPFSLDGGCRRRWCRHRRCIVTATGYIYAGKENQAGRNQESGALLMHGISGCYGKGTKAGKKRLPPINRWRQPDKIILGIRPVTFFHPHLSYTHHLIFNLKI